MKWTASRISLSLRGHRGPKGQVRGGGERHGRHIQGELFGSGFGRHLQVEPSKSELNNEVNVYGQLLRSMGLGIAQGAENLGPAYNLNLSSNPNRGYQT